MHVLSVALTCPTVKKKTTVSLLQINGLFIGLKIEPRVADSVTMVKQKTICGEQSTSGTFRASFSHLKLGAAAFDEQV